MSEYRGSQSTGTRAVCDEAAKAAQQEPEPLSYRDSLPAEQQPLYHAATVTAGRLLTAALLDMRHDRLPAAAVQAA